MFSIGTTSVQLKAYHSEYMLSFVHMYECQKYFRAKLKNCRVATGDTELRPPGSCQLFHYMLPLSYLIISTTTLVFIFNKAKISWLVSWLECLLLGPQRTGSFDLGFDSLRLLALPLCINRCYWWRLW